MKDLDRFITEEEIIIVRTSKSAALMLVLLLSQPICLFAGGIPVYAPNPVGEKLYRAYMLHETLPVFILILGLATAATIHSLLLKTHKSQPPNWSPPIRFM